MKDPTITSEPRATERYTLSLNAFRERVAL
jgi:hypothetical protein